MEKRSASSISVFLIVVASVLAAPPAKGEVAAPALRVCPTCEHRTVKGAVASAPAGGVIRVEPGTYEESEILVSKPLRIEGRGNAVVDGGGSGNVFVIQAEGVELAGLTILNSGHSYVEDFAGVKVQESRGCVIRKNKLRGNFFALHVDKSSDCRIEDNEITGSEASESAAGNGIHIWYGERMIIRGNRVSGHRDGIYFEFVKGSLILGNRVEGNLRYGLHFMFSDGNEYRENHFIKNASGVAVMYSKNVKMIANRFERSWGGAAYGALLKDISAGEIRGNAFVGNTVGIYMEGTTRTHFEMNRFSSNGWAIRVLGNCDGNRFTRNDFVGNTFDASTNASGNMNSFSENFWSAYRGLDLDRDGIGDTAYRPISLSSVLIERFGVSVVLMRSFFFRIADEAERLLPVLTPETFRDDRPLMRRAGT